MTREALDNAEYEARQFLLRVAGVKNDEKTIQNACCGVGNKKTGALRRQSLELTRALAGLRKS